MWDLSFYLEIHNSSDVEIYDLGIYEINFCKDRCVSSVW